MKLINTNGVLDFISEGNETESEQAFIERMQSYKMKANGATIQIYDDQGEQLITCINPFDNTQFICAESGYTLASDFGAKRFLADEARALMSEEKSEHPDVIKFPRDLSFPIENREDEIAIRYRQFDLAGALNQFRSDKDKFYVLLSDLFNRCADFTPGKQDEYLSGGKKEDKYCRFNLMNNEEKQTVSTNQVFLMDDENNIAGTISATVIHGNDGTLDVYFYDEIVDYFTLLNSDEIAQLYEMSQQLNNEKDAAVVSELEKEIAALIEPKRMSLMAQLFAAARQSIRNSVSDLDEKIANGLVHAFIRAASGRVDAYVDLGCGKTNTGNFVIHGGPTAQLKMLDAHIKTWAAEQLKDLQPKLSPRLSLISSESSEAVSADLSPESKGFRK